MAASGAGQTSGHGEDVEALHEAVYRDGIAVVRQALPVSWADQLYDDVSREFLAALGVVGGTAARGYNRYYFEPYIERTPGFLALAEHALVRGLSVRTLGDDYRFVEWGCDLPLPGAEAQWPHRDFPMPRVTHDERRLTSLAVNASCIDVAPNNGPFMIAKGTHFDAGLDFIGQDYGADDIGGMFPVDAQREAYEARLEPLLGRRGSFSIRSGLTIHGGGASETNRSRLRPTVILGIVSPEDRAWVPNPERLRELDNNHIPRIRLSEEYLGHLRAEHAELLAHLSYEVVAATTAELPPHRTYHDFEGLIMGNDPQRQARHSAGH
jgi:hypothetical protein